MPAQMAEKERRGPGIVSMSKLVRNAKDAAQACKARSIFFIQFDGIMQGGSSGTFHLISLTCVAHKY